MSESVFFYGTLIDPILKSMRKRVAKEIQSRQSVIDIACGTGAQVFEIARIANRTVGIDLSESMIKYAIKESDNLKTDNTEFIIADATDLSQFKENEFDIATMSLALHQFPPEIYTPVLSELNRIAKRLVIVDYAVPLPRNYAGVLSHVIEFLAGKTHNKNFKSFYKLGGLNQILRLNSFKIQKSVSFAKGTFHLVICET